ncbi:MAG: phage tail tube protein [Hyphomicrobiales bacterium]
MAQQVGRELLIKAGDGESPEVFTIVAGMRTQTFSMSANEIDTTVPNKSDPSALPQYTALPGILNQSFSGSGLFDSDDAGKQLLDDARTGNVRNYQIVVPGYGTFEGPYGVFDMELSGGMEEPLAFSAKFSQTDLNIFTAV